MAEDYFMNSEQEKFETTEKRCVYCRKNESVGNESNYYQEMFLKLKQIDLIVYSSVKYNRISVCIPRCLVCKYNHEDSKDKSFTPSLFFAIGIFILFNILCVGYTGTGIVISIVSGLAFYSKHYIKILKKHHIKSAREGSKDVAFIQELIKDGWQLERPSP
jgi:hypothetical protein